MKDCEYALIRMVGGILFQTLHACETLGMYGLEGMNGFKFPGEPDFPGEPQNRCFPGISS